MELSLFEQTQTKKLTRRTAILLFAITLFYAAVCTPLYLVMSSDVLWAQTPLPMLLDVIMTLANYCFYWVAFAHVAYTVYRFGFSAARPQLAVYAGASVFQYAANLLAGYLVIGFPLWEDFASDELPYLILNIFLNLLLMAIAVGLAYLLEKKQGDGKGRMTDGLPLVKLFSMQKGIGRAAWVLACVPAAAQLLSRVRYDISYGAPRSLLDLVWMVVFYCSDVLSVLIGYLVIVLVWNQISFKETEAKKDFEGSSVI